MKPGNRRGFTYLIALLLTGISAAGALAGAQVWSAAQQREKEAELIWIGNQFVQAIGAYYERTPGTVKRYPEKLEDLVEDHRYLSVQRRLRRIYRDPITGTTNWGIVRAPDGGVMGIYSLSDKRAIGRQAPIAVTAAVSDLSYRDWRFVYEPLQPTRSPSSAETPR